MAKNRIAYGKRDNIRNAISNGTIPPGCIILTQDSREIFFYDLGGEVEPYEERYKFSSKEEAEAWINKYECNGHILSIHEGDKCNIYVVGYDNELHPVSSNLYLQETRNPTEDDYEYDELTHWVNIDADRTFILIDVVGNKANWYALPKYTEYNESMISRVGLDDEGRLAAEFITTKDMFDLFLEISAIPAISDETGALLSDDDGTLWIW